jgi:hypothetical protein
MEHARADGDHQAAEQRHAPAVPSLSRVAVQQLQVDAREERRQFTFSGGAIILRVANR